MSDEDASFICMCFDELQCLELIHCTFRPNDEISKWSTKYCKTVDQRSSVCMCVQVLFPSIPPTAVMPERVFLLLLSPSRGTARPQQRSRWILTKAQVNMLPGGRRRHQFLPSILNVRCSAYQLLWILKLINLMASLSVGVAVMRLQNPPVNSLSLEFLTEFCITVEKLEMDKSCRGLILTSVTIYSYCSYISIYYGLAILLLFLIFYMSR